MSFVIYDVETTGLSKRYDQIVQFGAIRLDARLNILERFQIRSRLQPHVIPSPVALQVTGTTIDDLLDTTRLSHFEMMREIDRVLRAWGPAVFMGYNSLGFDEEFVRHARYQSLLDPYLTNTQGNTRGDVLRLARAAAHFRSDFLAPATGPEGYPSMRLQDVATALGYPWQRGHEAMVDVEATAFVCQAIASRAPEVWSRFLQFTTKSTAVEFMQYENAFVLFHPTGQGRGCYVVCFFGRHPTNANLHYCVDLSRDLEALRLLPEEDLKQALAEPGVLWRVRANAGPVLFPIYEGLEKAFNPLTEDEAERIAARLRADEDFIQRLLRAAVANEKTYPPSDNVEDQLYNGFFSDDDKFLMGQFHAADWPDRLDFLPQMRDRRLQRIGQRIAYFERPDLLSISLADRLQSAIRNRWQEGTDPPWRTIAIAREELSRSEGWSAVEAAKFNDYLSGLE